MEEEAHIMLGKTGRMGHFYPHELLLVAVLRLCRGGRREIQGGEIGDYD
jgi:hypothetical protein